MPNHGADADAAKPAAQVTPRAVILTILNIPVNYQVFLSCSYCSSL